MAHLRSWWPALFAAAVVGWAVGASLANPVPVYAPTYSARYSDNEVQREMLVELKAIRALLQQQKAQVPLPASLKAFLVQHCAACHTEGKAKGDTVLLLKDGSVPPFSLAEKRLINGTVKRGEMPQDHQLTEAEKVLLNDFLYPKEEQR